MTIDSYLAELRRLLPRVARVRALPEVREHLRDAAARHRAAGMPPGDAEVRATGEFGDATEVATRLGRELAVRETRLASLLALLAVAMFVFPLYVIPENTLGPAPWVEKPRDIAALQNLALGLWVTAGVLATASVVLAWTRRQRTASTLLVAVAVAMLGVTAASIALYVRWHEETLASPSWAIPPAVVCVGAVAAAAAWNISTRRRLGGSVHRA